MWKGDEAEATAPIQTVNAETLKGLKAHDGRKGQGLGDFRRWAPQGLGERKGLRLTPRFPTWVPERKMLPSTVTRNHVEGTLEMFSASFREPVPPLCFSLPSPELCCTSLKAWDGANSML